MSRHSKREEEERDILGELGGWIVYILLIIGLTYLIITFVGQRTMVSGSSMETTLQDGDNLIVDKISYRFRDPKRYDIIVFPYKYEEDTYFNDHKDLVIYTPDAILKYKIFAAYRTDDRHILLYYNLGAEDYNRQAYLNDILNQRTMGAMLDQSAPVSTESKILTLSTCDRAGDAYRYVVQAYLLEKME